MKWVTYLAKIAFRTGPNGECLFYGPWHMRKPYLVPDAATEHRLFVKELWCVRIFLVGGSIASIVIDELIGSWGTRAAVYAAIILVLYLARAVVLHRDLAKLSRVDISTAESTRSPMPRTPFELWVILACSVALAGVCIWRIAIGSNVTGALLFLGLCSIAIGLTVRSLFFRRSS